MGHLDKLEIVIILFTCFSFPVYKSFQILYIITQYFFSW